MRKHAMLVIMTSVASLIPARNCLAADYVVLEEHVHVSAPPDVAWAKVGGFCDITKFTDSTCRIVSGDGGIGTVRQVDGNPTGEPMTGKTELSYSYQGKARAIDFHGMFKVTPDGTAGSTVSYTVIYDQESFPADRQQQQRKQYASALQQTMPRIKQAVEGP